jgi:aspartate/tyrosine/aromatic aminotransferase
MKPPDSLFGVNKACIDDPDKRKVNVTVGAYRTDDGKCHVLPAVRIAEERIFDAEMNLGSVHAQMFLTTYVNESSQSIFHWAAFPISTGCMLCLCLEKTAPHCSPGKFAQFKE